MKKILTLCFVAGIISSCNMNPPNNNANDQTAFNKEKMQRFYNEVMNAHNTAMIDSFCTSDVVDHGVDPRYPKGIEGVKAVFTDFFAGYPDLHVETNWVIASGDTVVAHYTMTGTNSGSFMGMPATNKQINIEGMDAVVIKDGKATEHWGYVEEGKMMQQLGSGGGEGAPADSSAMSK